MRRESYLSQPPKVEVYAVESGTDVILRKNIEEVEKTEIYGGDEETSYKIWECDEAQLRYPGSVTAEEIESDFDYWFEKAETFPEPTQTEGLSLEDAKKLKYQEIASACEQAIYAGVDVAVSTGTEHFSLTEKDQINLFGKKMQLLAGEEKLEYHEDGQPCKYFTAADMQKIVDTAMFYVSYNTTYCNALNMWIKSISKASELEQIQWGVKIPEEFQNEVLKDYVKAMASGGIA